MIEASELTVSIAVGKSRRTGRWKNVRWPWPKLRDRLQEYTFTSETLAEYAAASKAERADIKDVGGFVGGYLDNGKRGPGHVVARSVITLDVDDTKGEAFLEAVEDALADYEYIVHSTHSHTDQEPRYRLVLPLDRETLPTEYIPVARRLASYVGIELFDETGYQPFRLMYWPSCAKDAEPVLIVNDGMPVPVDGVLDTYRDWTDVSAWPTSKAFADKLRDGAARQANPLEKPGAIGLFCRTYDIHQAIEQFLPDRYEPGSVDDRYTYTDGSTANGLVVYEDGLFAFSHHGSDPASYKLCNAYDLVRLHLFGDLDTSPTSKASASAMNDLVYEDPEVRVNATRERHERVKDAFPDLGGDDDYDYDEEGDEDDDAGLAWTADLTRDKRGVIQPSAQNLRTIFDHDPRLAGRIRYNEFDTYAFVFPGVPWRKVREPERMTDVDFAGLRAYLEIVYGISAASKIDDARMLVEHRNRYHPVQDYLNLCADEWDGERRIGTLLRDYQGAEHNEYTETAMLTWMAAAVARIFEPGIKFDMVLVLQGGQGSGKSTFLQALGGEHYSDTFGTFEGSRSFEQLHGAWIIEIAELAGMSKSSVDQVKGYISKQVDQYRKAYGRAVTKYARQCVFGATTNNYSFLQDSTGNRRFMPIKTDPASAPRSPHKLMADRELVRQLWGEAMHEYHAGRPLYFKGRVKKMHEAAQRRHEVQDARIGIIESYLDMRVPPAWKTWDASQRQYYFEDYDPEKAPEDARIRDKVTAIEVWVEALQEPRGKFVGTASRAINSLIQSVPGWEVTGGYTSTKAYGRQRSYQRIAQPAKREVHREKAERSGKDRRRPKRKNGPRR